MAGGLSVALLWALKGAPLRLEVGGPWALRAGRQELLGRGPLEAKAEGAWVLVGGRKAHEWRLQALGSWGLYAGTRQRRLRAPLRLVAQGGRLVALAELPLEDWVVGVGAAEVDGPWPRAAREALAIAARSSAWAWRGRHRAEGFDLCDSTHCMAFRGLEAPDGQAEQAALATQGLVAWVGGKVVPLPWHATCGGATAKPEDVFGGPMAGLRGVSDLRPQGGPWCAASPHAAPWTQWVPQARLASALARAGAWAPGWRAPRLGAAHLGAEGVALSVPLGEGRSLPGYHLWQILGAELGWGAVKSPAYRVRPQADGAWLEGRGLGHLVGMCQWGAKGRAEAGWQAQAILKAYAPGLSVARLRP